MSYYRPIGADGAAGAASTAAQTAQSPITGVFNWLTGSGTTGTELDKRPAGSIDLLKLWIGMKHDLAKKFGIYQYPDGRPVTIEGRWQPQLNHGQVVDLFKYWTKVGDIMREKLFSAGKGSRTGVIIKAGYDFLGAKADWDNWVNRKYDNVNGYKNKFLFAPATDRAMQVLARYVRDLDNGMWAGYNIESEVERMRAALPAWLRPIYDVAVAIGTALDKGACQAPIVKDICDAVDTSAKILKWMIFGTVAVGGFWAVSKMKKRESHA
jgi:hypothetical protein